MSNRYGFKSDKGKVYLQRCPKCGLENWAMSVTSGVCAWCGYKATLKDIGEEKEKDYADDC